MLKMMELENQEDYRYCHLSLLESCRAVVNALAAGRIAPFEHKGDKADSGAAGSLRYAPSFVPKGGLFEEALNSHPYTIADIARFLGRTRQYTSLSEKNRNGERKVYDHPEQNVRAALRRGACRLCARSRRDPPHSGRDTLAPDTPRIGPAAFRFSCLNTHPLCVRCGQGCAYTVRDQTAAGTSDR